MRTLMTSLIALATTSCLATDDPADDIEEPLTEEEATKADDASLRHYLLTVIPGEFPQDPQYEIRRAGGGKLRCPDDELHEVCNLADMNLVLAANLNITAERVFDELEDNAMIARGRLVLTENGYELRASALTRGITTVQPAAACFRYRPQTTGYRLEQLDKSTVEKPQVVYFDHVDPTPDFWGQPTPAVQAKIDAGLEVAKTRPVYVCGEMDRRDSGDLFWSTQLFVPKT